MLFTLALLALLVLAWLSYSVVLALLERRDRRDLYKRATAEIRRRPPTMPPRTPRPAKGFFGLIPPYPMPAPAPPHVSTMPYGEGLRTIVDFERRLNDGDRIPSRCFVDLGRGTAGTVYHVEDDTRSLAPDILEVVRARRRAKQQAENMALVPRADTGNAGLDEILNAPEPGPGASVDELMRATMTPRELERWNNRMIADALRVPASQIRSGSIMDTERRACRPPLDHSSDADPWLDAK